MHLSMHNWMRPEPLEMTVRRLARFGYESIEISGEPERYDTQEVRALLKRHGIRCWGSVTLMLGERNLIGREPAQRAASVRYVKDCVTMVKELDGFELTVVPGTVGKVVPDATPEVEWGWAVETMREIYDHAEAANRCAQAVALAEATGPNCGVCLDAFHINIEEADPLQSIREAGDRLVDFHVADNNRMACGMGNWDWAELVATLREVGYDDALTVEFVAPIDRTPADPHPGVVEAAPADATPEELQFILDHGSSVVTEAFYEQLVEKCAQTLMPLIR